MTDAGLKPQQALRISETILKTARIEQMRDWYRTVLGMAPSIEHMPKRENAAGEVLMATNMRLCFFELNEDYPYTQTIGLFEFPGTVLEMTEASPGLHHMQLHAGSMEDLVGRFEILAAKDIRPARSMNHGISTSFYYQDPDGNKVEITANNFATLDEHRAYLKSETFRSNPSGVEIDADDFRARFRAGEPIESLRNF